ncbi:hypothetical protein EVAR_22436_1, partial [Eumeta japonica]
MAALERSSKRPQ